MGKKNLNPVPQSQHLHFKDSVAMCGYYVGQHRCRTFLPAQIILSDGSALFRETFSFPRHPSPPSSKLLRSPENLVFVRLFVFSVTERPPSGEERRCRDALCLITPDCGKEPGPQFSQSALLGRNQIYGKLPPQFWGVFRGSR